MTSRERIKAIVNRKNSDRTGFWMGNPHDDSWPALEAELTDVSSRSHEGVRKFLGDDFRWISPEWLSYEHPEEKPMFEFYSEKEKSGGSRILAEAESVQEIEDYDWPDPDLLNFEPCLNELRKAGSVYRASGFWSPFFHIVSDLFGMENYFIKMYTNPDVVHAATTRIVDFYIEANKRFFDAAGPLVDGFFFGNDFGTQIDLLISPECFREFVFPYFRKLTALGHEYNYQVILHSCGSIYKVIPDLIELGVDALHPLQAMASNMEAEKLGGEFGGAVSFIGGIDTQDLLVNGSPAEIAADVQRVKTALGPHLVVSPSHEALLPNVPPINVAAMSEAARGI